MDPRAGAQLGARRRCADLTRHHGVARDAKPLALGPESDRARRLRSIERTHAAAVVDPHVPVDPEIGGAAREHTAVSTDADGTEAIVAAVEDQPARTGSASGDRERSVDARRKTALMPWPTTIGCDGSSWAAAEPRGTWAGPRAGSAS